MRNKQPHNLSSQKLNVNYRKTNNEDTMNEVQYQNLEKKRLKKEGLTHLYNQDFQPANYQKALLHKYQRSYMKKLSEQHYRQMQTFQDTNQLKIFGLGPYFYIQFMRRIVWFFLFATIIDAIRIYINYKGNGLGSYSLSFSTFLITSTLGNFTPGVLTANYDSYIVSVLPSAVYAAFFIWFLIWKYHYFSLIEQQEQNNDIIKPQKFCVQIQGIDQRDVSEEDLEKFFSVFGPIYEVSLVRQYKNKLSYFQDLEELQEEIKEEQLQIILGSGDQQHAQSLKKQKMELEKYINTLRISPKILTAYIHFQFQKSKVEMLTYYNKHYLFDSFLHAFTRNACGCCLDVSPTFNGQQLLIKNQKVPSPDDINWQSRQISDLSKFCRVLFGILIIIIFLAISCTIIGLCSIYISGHSINCEGVTIPATVLDATNVTDSTIKTCFCSSNLFASFNDVSIQTYCGQELSKLYTQQGIQWAVVATSGLTNFLFGKIVHFMVNLARPESYSNALKTKTVIFSLFMIFNTIILPILIYADIFGFKATRYVSFITIISTDAKQFFNVDSINLYVDFNQIWYRNVSPVFTNYIIFDILFTWGFLILGKCMASKSSLEDDEGKILQKHMNQKITSYKYDVYVETAYFNLIITMGIFLSAGVPILLPLAFISLFSKYLSTRILLIGSSTRIQGLHQDYLDYFNVFIPIVLVCTSLIGEWMLSALKVIIDNINMTIPINVPLEVLQRQLKIPMYIIIAIVIAFYFLFFNTVVRFCSWLSSLCYNRKNVVHPYHTLPFSQYEKKLNITASYNIRRNDKFKNIIINLQKHIEDQKI